MDAGAGGQIHGISLDSFLQMVQMERTTCTLTVKSKNQVGYLYLLEGELIAAEAGNMKNVEAACKIISWPESIIEIENSCNRTENEINKPLMNILMEGLRLRDNAILAAQNRARADKAGVAEASAKKSAPPSSPEDRQAESGADEFSLDDLELEISDEPSADIPAEVLPDELSFEDLEIKPPEELSLELSLEDLSLQIPPEPSEADAAGPPEMPPEAPPAEIPSAELMKPLPTEAPEDLMEKLERTEARSDRYIPVKEKPKIDPKKKHQQKRIMLFSALGILTVIVAISSVVSMRAMKSKQAEEAYQRVLTAVEKQETLEEKVSILQDFIDSDPKGAYAETAGNKIVEIRKVFEDQDFQKLADMVDHLPLNDNFEKEAMAAYDQYLSTYPDGSRTEDVRNRISNIPGLVDDIDFEKLKAVAQSDNHKQISAYNLYLTHHPKGKHRKSVEQLISDLSETYYESLKNEISVCDTEQRWEKCIERCAYFISTFKNHQKWDEMVVVRNEMQAKSDLANLSEKAKQEIADNDYEGARQLYLTYLEKNPGSPVKGEIAGELAKIDKKLAEKDKWQKIADLSRDGNYSVFEREQALKRYIANNPSGPFAPEAKARLRQIETEKQTVAEDHGKGARQAEPSDVAAAASAARTDTGRILAEREKAVAQLQSVDRFVANSDGTFTDSMTGLMWCILDSTIELGRCIDHKSAVEYVEGLTTGGHRDWRLPTSSDLAALCKSKPFFPGNSSPWYWTAKTVVDGYHVRAEIVTSEKETVFKREYSDVDQCGAVRAVRP